MSLSLRPLFLLMTLTLTLTLGVSSCKTTTQAPKSNSESRFIENVQKVRDEGLPSNVFSKHNQARPELKYVFPKLSELQNLTGEQVQALLGTPGFKRSDSPAEIWQYQNYKCTLDLFLYENLNTAIHNVVHFEIRLRSDQAITKKKCFETIIKDSSKVS